MTRESTTSRTPPHGPRRARGRGRRVLALFGLLCVAAAIAAGLLPGRRSRPAASGGAAHLDLLRAALDQFHARDYDGAIATLDRRGGLVKPDALDRMLRARIARERGRPEEAIAELGRIPDSSAVGAKARLFEGQIEMGLHRARLAERAFLRSLELEPRQVQPYRELISIYTMQQRRKDCDALFRDLVGFAELDHILSYAWSQNECGLLDPNEAVGILRECVAADPEDRWSRLALATTYLWTHAHDELKDTLAPLPADDPDARAIRVESAMDRGEVEEAERLAGGPPSGSPRLELARAKLSLGRADPRASADAFRRVLEAEPSNREATRCLGLLLHRLGDPEGEAYLKAAALRDELRRTIHEAIHGDVTDPRLYVRLGTLCESLGLAGQARAWYRLVLGKEPANAEARRAVERLAGEP
ncbi:hypothetical protein OJF2_13260 [Aquisphaera giovannonii]|uniref:Tetratricopeptide repeat protein n=1 Tax=Aquisphaera giovannonii TaxID=406548 RepID=A0A5B9VX55_9BACT|nr:tetratricopeptide repeat protein [Aquisphaera giovannonii]QEH32842.1 hypothetical protein OJF2_13260 [Aquisphaera giovannonii]